jgi:hypothetical protein
MTDICLYYQLTFAGAAAIWGVIAVGLFADNPEPLDTTSGRSGLFKGKSPPQPQSLPNSLFHVLDFTWI